MYSVYIANGPVDVSMKYGAWLLDAVYIAGWRMWDAASSPAS